MYEPLCTKSIYSICANVSVSSAKLRKFETEFKARGNQKGAEIARDVAEFFEEQGL